MDEGGIRLDEGHVGILNACENCVHIDLEGLLLSHRCDAFPAGIPMPIWLGDDIHSKPYEGDNGIQFEFDANRREAELKAEKKRKRRQYFRSISG